MRNVFIQELIKAAKKNNKIFLLVGDLGYSVIEPFVKQFRNRFYNIGVAEQNMLGVACGIASEGYHVFVYSIANFSTFRCAEQIRNDVDYHNFPVTIVSIGGGVGYGNLGYSHQAIQDFALMRSFPNMLIAAPGDVFEMKSCVQYLIKNPQPSYLRIPKSTTRNVNKKQPKIKPGKWNLIYNKKKSGKTILTTGSGLQIANEQFKKKKYKDFNFFSLPLWGMKYKKNQKKYLKNVKKIITFEDHLEDGGFGSWVKECNSESKIQIKIKALKSKIIDFVADEKEYIKMSKFHE